MTEDDIRREDADPGAPEHESDAPTEHEADAHAEMLRSLPRLRSIATDEDDKVFVPPPPTVSRIGGLAQGWGAALPERLTRLQGAAALSSDLVLPARSG